MVESSVTCSVEGKCLDIRLLCKRVAILEEGMKLLIDERENSAVPKDMPSGKTITKFLKVFSELCIFEATVRETHHMGVFKSEECPIPEVVEITKWLGTFT